MTLGIYSIHWYRYFPGKIDSGTSVFLLTMRLGSYDLAISYFGLACELGTIFQNFPSTKNKCKCGTFPFKSVFPKSMAPSKTEHKIILFNAECFCLFSFSKFIYECFPEKNFSYMRGSSTVLLVVLSRKFTVFNDK